VFPTCKCFSTGPTWALSEVGFHVEPQDTESDAWKQLLHLIEEAASDGRAEFNPRKDMDPDAWARIVTLPRTISKLKAVTHLMLYGSHLVRIPAEIGQMTSLERFTPYTSWRLHWFPYEITHCKNLRLSTVSTRSLYGNYKFRPPFPRLRPSTILAGGSGGSEVRAETPEGTEPIRRCSVCERPFEDSGLHRVWISLRVATDVLPLLVNSCSDECIRTLPVPAEGYVQEPHRGGLEVRQPAARM